MINWTHVETNTVEEARSSNGLPLFVATYTADKWTLYINYQVINGVKTVVTRSIIIKNNNRVTFKTLDNGLPNTQTTQWCNKHGIQDLDSLEV